MQARLEEVLIVSSIQQRPKSGWSHMDSDALHQEAARLASFSEETI